MEGKIKYYPVANGDQSLISIRENNYTTTILVDCNIRKSCLGTGDISQFDIKADLLRSLGQRDGIPYVDIFILTHGDCDHCRGFETHFYQGPPKNYSQQDKKDKRIFIDVLWFSPMAVQEIDNAPDADCFKKEALRRIKLHNDNSPDKDLPGNKIVIIGYDGNQKLEALNVKRKVPGDIITRFNERELATFSIFIHAPYKKQLAGADNKNHTSIVFQARFRKNLQASKYAVLAMFGGDADYIAWDLILQSTIKYGNVGALDWDLFLAPHHCSWTFFNESGESEPKDSSLIVLDFKREGGLIIASSKKVEDNDDNPPSYAAKQQYLKKLDKNSHFLNTDTEPTEKSPQPIVFQVTENGPSRVTFTNVTNAQNAGGGSGAPSLIISQG